MVREFEDKKDEFNFYALKALDAKNKGDMEMYVINLRRALNILSEIEEKEVDELIEEEEYIRK